MMKDSSPRSDPSVAASQYVIALARDEDVPALPAIELAAGELFAGYVPDDIPYDISDEQELRDAQRLEHLWVALAENVPVGFAHVIVPEPSVAHLEELDVHPAHGRRGLGTRLVTVVCEWAAANGYCAVTLTTFRDVPWNMPVYARLGFVVVPFDELSPALRSIVVDETRRGLDPAYRVVMRWLAQGLSCALGSTGSERVSSSTMY